MTAVDDGIWNGNLDFADICFLVAVVVAVIAAVLAIPRDPPRSAWTAVFGWAAVALIALGFLVL